MEGSAGLPPTALARTPTWPRPALGSGMSSSFSTCGPPNSWMRMAFIGALSLTPEEASSILEPEEAEWHNPGYEQIADRDPGPGVLLAGSDPASAEARARGARGAGD